MEPIDVRADTTFSQALRCVQYRLPRADGYRSPGYVLALGMRYGLIGVAACHHLLVTSEEFEESRILSVIGGWPDLVEDHARWEMVHRLPFPAPPSLPHLVGRIASLPSRPY